MTGDYTQSSGTLQIELASPSSFDKLVVSGNLTLGGTLSVSLLSGYSPAAGAIFDILDWGTLTGTFSTLQLPPLTGSLAWNTTGLYTDGVLAVTGGAGLPGDYNASGAVDAADYVVWRKTNGSQAGYDLWRSNFGRTAGSGTGISAAAAVPEPANILMVLTASLAASITGSRRLAGSRQARGH